MLSPFVCCFATCVSPLYFNHCFPRLPIQGLIINTESMLTSHFVESGESSSSEALLLNNWFGKVPDFRKASLEIALSWQRWRRAPADLPNCGLRHMGWLGCFRGSRHLCGQTADPDYPLPFGIGTRGFLYQTQGHAAQQLPSHTLYLGWRICTCHAGQRIAFQSLQRSWGGWRSESLESEIKLLAPAELWTHRHRPSVSDHFLMARICVTKRFSILNP